MTVAVSVDRGSLCCPSRGWGGGESGNRCRSLLLGGNGILVFRDVVPRAGLFVVDTLADGWEQEAVLQGHGHGVRALAALPDGSLASGAGDGIVKLWSFAGEPRHRHAGGLH